MRKSHCESDCDKIKETKDLQPTESCKLTESCNLTEANVDYCRKYKMYLAPIN